MSHTEQGSEATAPVAIIGYGTACVNAIIALRDAGYAGDIRVFSSIDTRPYSPILTSYYAGGQMGYEECFPWSEEELDELSFEVLSASPVTELDCAHHLVKTEAGAFPYSKCIVASGSTPMTWGFPEVSGEGGYEPLVLRTMADAQRLKCALESKRCKRLLVSGASMVALKALEAALNKGVEVTLVGMNPHVLDFNALPEAAIRFEKGLREKGVTLKLGQTIAAVKRVQGCEDGDDWHLEVDFSSGEHGSYDEIFVAHGMKSNLDFVNPSELEIDRALVVDEHMRTSDADVYAAGDVAQATELISGEKRVVGIWKNAALQGACAGAAIAAELTGEPYSRSASFAGSISSNTIAVNGTLFISAGTVELNDRRHVEVRESDEMTVVYVLESQDEGKPDKLVGFNITSDVDEPGGVAYDTGAMLTMRIEHACCR